LVSNFEEGGIFLFNDEEKMKIGNANISGRSTYKDKAIVMLSYLFELAYDLAIAPSDNVSSNPGFESILGCC